MRLDFGETVVEEQERLTVWHKWFAWYPVFITSHDWRWLEFVERKGEWHDNGLAVENCWRFKYRLIVKLSAVVLKD